METTLASETCINEAGVYTGRIVKAEKAAELLLMQATKVQLVINTKTAKVLGITIAVAR
jgi:putative ABC transport system substrate-binding protein